MSRDSIKVDGKKCESVEFIHHSVITSDNSAHISGTFKQEFKICYSQKLPSAEKEK